MFGISRHDYIQGFRVLTLMPGVLALRLDR